jgi:O-antigen/teichoic acid export membrane protein
VLAGGTALGQAITVLASPILTRLYTPEDFGVLAVYSSILGILSVIASWRYELAIPLPEQDEDAVNLVALSLGIVVLMSLIVGLGAWLLGAQVVQWLNAPGLRPYLWLLPIGVLLVGSYQIFNYWAVRKQAFGVIAKTKLHQGLGAVLTQVSSGFLKSGPLGLIVGQIVGQCAGLMTLAGLLLRADRAKLQAISWPDANDMARRYRRFPQFSSFAGLINSAGLQIPVILLAFYYGPQVTGWFALAQRVLGVPMNLVGQAISQVYMGTGSQLGRHDVWALRSLFFKTVTRLLLLGSVTLGVLAIGGPWLFARIFGANWGNAGRYLQVLCPAILAQFVVAPLSQTMNILEHQDWQLKWDIFRLALVVFSISLTFAAGGTPWQAILVYSLNMIIAYTVLFLMNIVLLDKVQK